MMELILSIIILILGFFILFGKIGMGLKMDMKNTETVKKREGKIIINYRKGSMDEFIIKEIFEMDEYSIDKMAMSKKAIIMDIGAHIGCFTLKSAAIANKGKIFSFEPMESNFKILERNVKTNNLNNVLFFHKGIAKKKGKRKLYLCTDNTGGHSISTKRSKKYEIINCISLKQVISENNIEKIDLLKLDCEGSEYEILYNTPKSIFIKIMRLILEFHDFRNTKNNFDKLYWFLRKNGFIMQRFKRYSEIHGMAFFTRTMDPRLTHNAHTTG